jgi:hypothetical protein
MNTRRIFLDNRDFWAEIHKKFIENARFQQISKPQYYKSSGELILHLQDLKQ